MKAKKPKTPPEPIDNKTTIWLLKTLRDSEREVAEADMIFQKATKQYEYRQKRVAALKDYIAIIEAIPLP